MIKRLTYAFPFWVACASAGALIYPPAFTWFKGNLITCGLGFIMLSMGATLEVSEFRNILRYPKWVFLGVLLQYTVMPLTGWILAAVFNLPVPFAVGIILVSCCPGGTASNVIAFLADAHVALSISMTLCSTVLAVVLTPVLTSVLVGDRLTVDAMGLFWSACQVVVLPLAAGVMMNKTIPRFTRSFSVVSPLVAVIFISLIVGSVIGSKRASILNCGPSLIAAVSLLHLTGFFLGYLIARIALKDHRLAKTVSIEVGMQNSGLGVVLARNNFSDALVAVPSALSSLTHCIIGSLLVRFWGKSQKNNN